MSHKINFVSLGCPKALVDSEHIITQLRAEGYDISNNNDDADLVVINTCGFIDDAIEESLSEIGEAIRANGNVIVTGCLGAKGDIVKSTYPNVLAVTGPHALHEVMAEVHKALPPKHDPFTSLIPPQGIKLTPKHYAYLKISEGCNHRCTFCIIPSLRGDLDSRPITSVLDEAQNLVNGGVKELLVISQDTSAYGVDTKYKADFWQGHPVKTQFQSLVANLAELDVWVRLHYVYPYPHVDEVMPLMAQGRILPYLDIPFQHASPTILKAMKRPASAENVLQRINKWREVCPEIVIRSTFIVGFPGESDQDFEQLLEFLHQAQLDRVGCFKYSAVEGAKANELFGAIDEDTKQRRFEQLMQTQETISQQKLKQRIGYQYQMLIDDITDTHLIGRSYAEAPDIDGNIIVELSSTDNKQYQTGDFVDVEIVDSNEHDLFGVLVN